MVETYKGTQIVHYVLLVPSLKEIFLSIGQMMERGYTFYFEGGVFKILGNTNKMVEITQVKIRIEKEYSL